MLETIRAAAITAAAYALGAATCSMVAIGLALL
jgi:hypothetical protein